MRGVQATFVAAVASVYLANAASLRSSTPASALKPVDFTKDVPATCESCKWVVKTLKCEIEDPDTQAELLNVITNQLCPALPQDISAQCLQLAPALVPGAIWYLDTFSTRDLCSDVALCGVAPPLTAALTQTSGLKAVSDNSTCAMCAYLKAAVGSSNVVCSSLPQALQSSCRAVAAAAGDSDCSTAGLCPPAWAQALPPPTESPLSLSPALVASLGRGLLVRNSQLVMGQPQLGASLRAYELCDICKTVIAEAAVILSNPDTQRQALEFAKEACAALGDLQNQCLSYVELYGPLVFNIVVQYLNTEACAKIGYCPAMTTQLHASGRGFQAS